MSLAGRRVVLDKAVLLLWLVGRTNVDLLLTFKRVKSFKSEDLDLLVELLSDTAEILTTPHVLAEVSNFVDQSPQYAREALIRSFRAFADSHVELYREAKALVFRPQFSALGLTDTGLLELSSQAVILTVDYRLVGKILAMGGRAENFHHLHKAV
jgi:hypothetical protein